MCMQLRYLVIRRYDVIILSQNIFFDFAIIAVVALLYVDSIVFIAY